MYRLLRDGNNVVARPFKADPNTAFAADRSYVLHVLELRIDARRPEGGDGAGRTPWRFDDPSDATMADFWRALLPTSYEEENADVLRQPQPLDLPDAAAVVERVFGPYPIRWKAGS